MYRVTFYSSVNAHKKRGRFHNITVFQPPFSRVMTFSVFVTWPVTKRLRSSRPSLLASCFSGKSSYNNYMAELASYHSSGRGCALLIYRTDFRWEWAFLPSNPANKYDQNCVDTQLSSTGPLWSSSGSQRVNSLAQSYSLQSSYAEG